MTAQAGHQSDDVLVVENLAKRFGLDREASRKYGVHALGSEMAGHRPRERPTLRPHEFWALQDVSFTLRRGEALGIVGSNGAGKTTLLRILHGLSVPDWGSVSLTGRSAALIELGTAFDGLSTGREAIYVEGVLLGLSRSAVAERERDIIAFSELGDVIDAPVRTYSQGMRMRLGYAIAAHTRPDVLLIDEVLAVGDAAFQRKCIGFILQHLDAGGSLVLISHDMWQIRAVSSTCMLLDRGRVKAKGEVQTVLKEYLESTAAQGAGAPADDGQLDDASHAVGVRLGGFHLEGVDGAPATSGAPATLSIEVRNDGSPVRARCVAALGPLDAPVAAVSSATDIDRPLEIPSGACVVRCGFDALWLIAATYEVRAALIDAGDGSILASTDQRPTSTVVVSEPEGEDQTPHQMIGTITVLDARWPEDSTA